ncbi:hypothetical protein COCNU_contig69438967G000010 [Cocos nucifera]|nr:hypothetical protein [Cocos nucifera]
MRVHIYHPLAKTSAEPDPASLPYRNLFLSGRREKALRYSEFFLKLKKDNYS